MTPSDPTFSAKEAAKLTGISQAFCEEILENPWMRKGGANAEGLTVRDLTLLAAAKEFKLRGNDRRRFFVRYHDHHLLDGPVVVFLFRDETAHIVDADKLFIYSDMPNRVGFYDNRELLGAIEAIDPPPSALF